MEENLETIISAYFFERKAGNNPKNYVRGTSVTDIKRKVEVEIYVMGIDKPVSLVFEKWVKQKGKYFTKRTCFMIKPHFSNPRTRILRSSQVRYIKNKLYTGAWLVAPYKPERAYDILNNLNLTVV